MSLKIAGRPPVVVVPLPVSKPQVTPEGAKSAFLGVLGRAVGYEAASKKIEEATFSLAGNTLEIQTNLSAPLLNMLFEGDVRTLLEGVLCERGAGNIRIKFLPALAHGTAPAPPQFGTAGTASAPFKRLAASAAMLNHVSDQLTTEVEQIDAALKQLNLGVAAWVTISENEDEDGNWSQEQIGYVRIGSRWGVALRSRSALRGDPGEPDETFSAFADAPRQLRIRAVEFIPKLLDQLSVEAEAMVAKLSPKVHEISKLTHALAFQTLAGQLSKPVANAASGVKK